MSLTGLPVLLALLAAAGAIWGATGWVWQRFAGLAALVVRSVMLLLVMASGAVLAADVANRQYGFYTSFAELTGGTGSAMAAAPNLGGSLDAATVARGRRLAQAGHGTVVWLQLDGARSHTRRTGLVYLPAAYFTNAASSLRFSVIELFHGNPGGPGNWTHQMHLTATLDGEIAAGRMPPVIAVAPSYTRTVGGECVNAPASADDTYLGVDIPVLLASQPSGPDRRRQLGDHGLLHRGQLRRRRCCAPPRHLHRRRQPRRGLPQPPGARARCGRCGPDRSAPLRAAAVAGPVPDELPAGPCQPRRCAGPAARRRRRYAGHRRAAADRRPQLAGLVRLQHSRL